MYRYEGELTTTPAGAKQWTPKNPDGLADAFARASYKLLHRDMRPCRATSRRARPAPCEVAAGGASRCRSVRRHGAGGVRAQPGGDVGAAAAGGDSIDASWSRIAVS